MDDLVHDVQKRAFLLYIQNLFLEHVIIIIILIVFFFPEVEIFLSALNKYKD